MEIDLWLSLLLYVALLFISAFFSGSESAFFSLPPAELRRFRKSEESSSAKRIVKLLEKPRRLLTTILIGNTIVNVSAATLAALLANRVLPPDQMKGWRLLAMIALVTFTILFFSEIVPKVFAVKSASRFAKRSSLILEGLILLFIPISFIFEKLTGLITRLLRIHKEIPFVNEEELKALIEIGEEKGALDPSEREMIHSIFEFRETMVKEIMIPRMDMTAIEKSTPVDEVLAEVKSKGHSRIPVYEEEIDNIIGILYVKDLLPLMASGKPIPALTTLVRKPYFVPQSKQIDELLKEFQKERLHIAIVVDEYGGTAGLITLEDVIEEIVGDIRDEYDREQPLARQVDDRTWLVDGKINIEELNDLASFDLPTEEDFESLGGFLFSELGRIPTENDSVTYRGIQFVIEKVQRRRIKQVRIVLPSEEEKSVN